VLGDGIYDDGFDEMDRGDEPGDARQVEGPPLDPARVPLGLFGLSDLKPAPPSLVGNLGYFLEGLRLGVVAFGSVNPARAPAPKEPLQKPLASDRDIMRSGG
jgi:hypothetical protein